MESFIGEHLKKAWSETYNADAKGCQTDDSEMPKSVTYCRQGRAEHFRSPRESCERRAFERLACNLLWRGKAFGLYIPHGDIHESSEGWRPQKLS
ncbi:hypothetical protein F3H14_32425, partial [Pseudomonas aeruginosa]